MDAIRTAKNIVLIAIIFLAFLGAVSVQAANVGDIVNFNIDKNYDALARSQVRATLIRDTPDAYFYIETGWWNTQEAAQKNMILAHIDALSSEFSDTIRPVLTATYGSEHNPGIDGDSKITILFQLQKEGIAGYARPADGYGVSQIPDSNQREMVYLPLAHILNPQLKVFLAHEFTHLIEFNQKERLRSAQEEVWLSEARADFSSTLLGYDNVYQGSNLEGRVQDFFRQPNDSLTEWQGSKYDYASVSLFTHYLVDHYGVGILADSLKSSLVGIGSLNEALARRGTNKNVKDVFTDWTLAMVINSCAKGPVYCYLNKNLSEVRVNPILIFLPLGTDSSLSTNNATKNWAPNWQKIIGGSGDLKLLFSSAPGLEYKVPYIIYDKTNNYVVGFLQIDSSGRGEISIKDFDKNFSSLVLAPSLQSKLSGFEGPELEYPYQVTLSVGDPGPTEDLSILQKLQAEIDVLKKQIADMLAAQGGASAGAFCSALSNNLYIGVQRKADVTCLQQLLKSQGSDVYPEGLVTGNFGNLTKAAVLRFQKKYRIPQTGFVGVLTRQKINTLL